MEITINLPDTSDVREGVEYGCNVGGDETILTGTCAVPEIKDVLYGVPVGDTEIVTQEGYKPENKGSLVLPTEAQVVEGVNYGGNNDLTLPYEPLPLHGTFTCPGRDPN